MSFTTEQIRTLAVAGHGQTGKTTLVEHLLQTAGVIPKAETVESGKTVSDFTPEEIERKISIRAALANLEWQGKNLNFWDTPGSSDFTGEVTAAFRASETALMLVDARSGVQIETIKLWRNLDAAGKPRMVFINKLDGERADFDACIQGLREQFKTEICPVSIPIGQGAQYKGCVDLLHGKAYDENGAETAVPDSMADTVKRAKEVLAGAAAEGDDDLLVKFIDEAGLSDEDIIRGLKLAMAAGAIVPVFAGSAAQNSGCVPLLDFIAEILPSPEGAAETVLDADGQEAPAAVSASGPLAAFVVKTANDQFSGKLSYIKVVSGTLTQDTEVFNVNEGKKEKTGKLYRAAGKKLTETRELAAGDVGVAAKLPFAKTNDTLAASADARPFCKLQTPAPVYSMAVSAGEKKDEDKLGGLLMRACEEDKTLSFVYNPETRQNVLSGMGDLHISIVLDRIRAQSKINILTAEPRIAYRETIQQKTQAEYTHKKQSGGHGQYGRVVLALEPLERGAGYSFTNAIFGGAISKGYIPGVEKGVKEAMESGVLAGYPVVDVGVTVVDGKEHPVDSSELAFKIAARNAFREAMKMGNPILLEPIMNLTVFVDAKNLGDIMSDLSGRRGHITGQNSLAGGIEEIRAQVPHRELLKYAIDLRAITSSTGSFEMELSHYSPISGKIADEVIAASKEFLKQSAEDA